MRKSSLGLFVLIGFLLLAVVTCGHGASPAPAASPPTPTALRSPNATVAVALLRALEQGAGTRRRGGDR